MTYVKTYLPTLKTHVVNLKRDAKDLSRDLQRLEVRGKLGSKTLYCLYFIYARKFYLRSQGKITRQWKSTPWEACSVTAFLKAVILWFLLMFLSSLQQLFSYSLSLALMLLLIQFQERLPTGLDWTGLAWLGLPEWSFCK